MKECLNRFLLCFFEVWQIRFRQIYSAVNLWYLENKLLSNLMKTYLADARIRAMTKGLTKRKISHSKL